MSLTVAEFAELNDLKVEDTIETLNNLFTEYEYDYSVSKEDDVLDENALEFLEDKGFIIDESQKSNPKEQEEKQTEKSSDTSSQINFDVEKFFYAYKQINALGDIFEELSNTFNINISSTEVSLEGFYNAKNTIKSIGAETITDLKENINDTKTLLEEKDANVALLFKFLNGDFNDEEGFYDEDLIEDAIEDAGITKDRYGLMDAAAEYNQILTDYYFEANWQNGAFLKEDGEIDYDAIDEYLKDNENVSSDVIERCKENQLFLNELGKGNLNGTDGEIDRDKVDDYVAEHPLVTNVDTIIENYEVQVANTDFINNFEELFMDEEGNINEQALNQYLEDNPRVSIDIAEQVVNTVKDNKIFQNEMEDGKFFDSEGNVDQTLVDKFVKDHPYTTLNTEDIYSQYEENYANTKLWEEYQNGTFLDNMGNWDEDAYQNYINEHPNATNGEDVKTWHLSEYPTLTTQEYQQQITQTVTVSFCCGVVDIFETVLDGGAFLLGTIGDALGIEGSKEIMGQFIQKDLSGALYDSWIGELGVRSDIAYGKAHTIGTVAGKFVGTALLAAVPGGSAVAATVGALSAAGSAAETAFQSGADVEQAFEVAEGAFILGAISGFGLDKIADSVKLGTMSLKQGLGTAALVSAAEPIGNSLIEYSAYGNKMTDSEGNVLYDNYLDYYIESGALLNTGIAIAGSTVKVGSSYLKGKAARKTTVEDTPKQALPEGKEKIQVIDQDVDGSFHTTEYDADDSMFKTSTNMDDYVDVDNIPDYPSNKTPALGAGNDNALEVLDDAADAVDDASKGLTKVADDTSDGLSKGSKVIEQAADVADDGTPKVQDYGPAEWIGDKYRTPEVFEKVAQAEKRMSGIADAVDDATDGLAKNKFNIDNLGDTTSQLEDALKGMDDITFKNSVSKLVNSDKLGLIKDENLLNKILENYITSKGSIDSSEVVDILKKLSPEQALDVAKKFNVKMSVFENMAETLGIKLNTDSIVECFENPNGAINKILVNMQNMSSSQKTNFYIKYISYFSGEGISISDFYKNFGIDTKVLSSNLDMAEFFGDRKLFLLESLKQKMNGLSVGSNEYDEISKLVSKYSKMSVADIDVTQMELEAKRFISSSDLLKCSNFKADNILTNVNCTYEELASIFNYTNSGGYEINSWLFDGSIYGKSTRGRYKTISDIQDAISGYAVVRNYPDGSYYINRNRTFSSSNGSILDKLDSILKKGNYDDAVVIYRGTGDIYDGNVRLNVEDLRIGDSFSSSGYQSSSALLEKCYGVTRADKNTILQIIVPPNSGVGAYIENLSGCPNYCQAEFLLKRNAKMTIVGDIYKRVINGIEKTIVPVVVQ